MSRFVSGGTNDEPTERDEAWLKAQQELETKRAQAAEANQQDGKSLYETLQANKAAKQEAFEESIRLKNQFRTLDEDEVDFLDSVLASTRKQEAEVRKETERELDAFRRQQEEAERSALASGGVEEEKEVVEQDAWKTGMRKRKKGRDGGFVSGVKVRRMSSTAEKNDEVSPAEDGAAKSPVREGGSISTVLPEQRKQSSAEPTIQAAGASSTKSVLPAPPAPSPGLGLGAYSSDEDD